MRVMKKEKIIIIMIMWIILIDAAIPSFFNETILFPIFNF